MWLRINSGTFVSNSLNIKEWRSINLRYTWCISNAPAPSIHRSAVTLLNLMNYPQSWRVNTLKIDLTTLDFKLSAPYRRIWWLQTFVASLSSLYRLLPGEAISEYDCEVYMIWDATVPATEFFVFGYIQSSLVSDPRRGWIFVGDGSVYCPQLEFG